ncbi:P-loop containing nucleoside triphosphate hydrolases superfamily protein [Artemisia annua]|uniref:P-loop containing nucleoside triphosphate hydrolases superfamily protein n=1 Tax=Artemisia annua TaxID=35608 RepID=A0A2U1LZR1_ARTAN|nr:P-loop containing nucleoside triphosphate hydrolases superfamily protein [Artemisia annua]
MFQGHRVEANEGAQLKHPPVWEETLIKKYQKEISDLKQELQQLKLGMKENPYMLAPNQKDLVNMKLQRYACFIIREDVNIGKQEVGVPLSDLGLRCIVGDEADGVPEFSIWYVVLA